MFRGIFFANVFRRFVAPAFLNLSIVAVSLAPLIMAFTTALVSAQQVADPKEP
ncbi:MAG: hypothetical protein ACR2G4_18930 [Pyrinomonadaceae bacterium]